MTGQLSVQFPEERRLATILFADLQGFTALAENLDFEIVSDLAKGIWEQLDKVILNHGGFVDKHMGDAVLAVWGVPHAGEDDAVQATAAALALHPALKYYLKKYAPKGVANLLLRVGIHTGPVMTSYIGLRSEYTIMGDAVNVAQRLQEQARPSSVFISASTYRLIRGLYQVKQLEAITLRGRQNPIGIYQVLEALPQPTLPRYFSQFGLETRMVGREKELSRLHQAFHQVNQTQKPQIMLISGEAGLGKSRLLMEFTQDLTKQEMQPHLFSGRGFLESTKAPFNLWKSFWFSRFKLQENDAPSYLREQFLLGIRALWGKHLSNISVIEVGHRIGDLIGISWPQSPYVGSEVTNIRNSRAFEITRQLFLRLKKTGPILLVVDDLNWVDTGSLALITFLLNTPEPLPLLVIGALRPSGLNQLNKLFPQANWLHLAPLPIDPKLMDQAYPNLKPLPPSVQRALLRRAEGNPYFLEELVKSLQNNSLLSQSPLDEHALLKHIQHGMPISLHSLLQARLDALPEDARGTALLASVVGRVFWTGAVEAAAQQSINLKTGVLNPKNHQLLDTLEVALQQLTQAEMAFERVGSELSNEREFIFKHALLQEVAYNMLPRKYRLLYHQAIAKWLGQRVGSNLKAIVAHHLERGGLLVQAADQYAAAAHYANLHGAMEESRWLSKKALELKQAAQ